jgi:hypothetical protein
LKRTTHTSRWLVTALVVLLGMAVEPAAAWADERPAPGYGIAALSEATGRPAPAYGVSQGLGATPASVTSIGDAPHDGLLSRPALADSLAAQLPSVVNLPRYETAAPRPAPERIAAPAAQAPTVHGGFDWLDAGIGIAIGFVVAALVGLALVTSSRRRGTLQGT